MRISRLSLMLCLFFFIPDCYGQALEECFKKNDTITLKRIIAKNSTTTLLQTSDSVALFLTDIVNWLVGEYKMGGNTVFRVKGDRLQLSGDRQITVGADSILTGYMNGDDFEINKILKRTGRIMNGPGLSNTFTNKRRIAYKVMPQSGGIKISNSFKSVLNAFLNKNGTPLVDGERRAEFLGSSLSGLHQSNIGWSINGKVYYPWHFQPDIYFEAIYFDYRHKMALVVYQYANIKDECYLKRNNNGEWTFDEKGQSIIYN